MMLVGLDPGFASFGYAVVELGQKETEDRVRALGVIRTEKSSAKRSVLASDDNVRRAREIAARLEALLSAHRVRVLAAEAMSFPRSASVAAKMAMAWGVLVALAHGRGLPLVQASPQEVKRELTGVKSASKDDVRFELLRRFGNETEDLLEGIPGGQHEHAWDALAAAVAAMSSDVVRAVRPGLHPALHPAFTGPQAAANVDAFNRMKVEGQ